jgi:hypothetical protein
VVLTCEDLGPNACLPRNARAFRLGLPDFSHLFALLTERGDLDSEAFDHWLMCLTLAQANAEGSRQEIVNCARSQQHLADTGCRIRGEFHGRQHKRREALARMHTPFHRHHRRQTLIRPKHVNIFICGNCGAVV